MNNNEAEAIIIRPYQPTDSIPEITALLHRAYAKPAGQGIRFWASRQDDSVTESRLKNGASFLAVKDGAIVGTISVYGPDKNSRSAYYQRDDVWHFGQFGVDPALQRTGLGKRLYQTVEDHCKKNQVKFLALDTCENATNLIEMYQRWGFKPVDRVKWEVVDFRSIIMAKDLTKVTFSPQRREVRKDNTLRFLSGFDLLTGVRNFDLSQYRKTLKA